MWICQNSSFLSIVQPSAADLKANPGTLLVRARRKGDIEATFPDAEVISLSGRDYLFRAFIDRAEVGAALADKIEAIDYGNFKNSVKNSRLHDAYARIWGVMEALQPTRAYATLRGAVSKKQKELL